MRQVSGYERVVFEDCRVDGRLNFARLIRYHGVDLPLKVLNRDCPLILQREDCFTVVNVDRCRNVNASVHSNFFFVGSKRVVLIVVTNPGYGRQDRYNSWWCVFFRGCIHLRVRLRSCDVDASPAVSGAYNHLPIVIASVTYVNCMLLIRRIIRVTTRYDAGLARIGNVSYACVGYTP